jgi:hypothetical protein
MNAGISKESVALTKALAQVTKEYVEAQLKSRDERIAALEQRLDVLEIDGAKIDAKAVAEAIRRRQIDRG